MNKRQLHHYYTRFRAVSLWPLLAAFVFFGIVATVGLRSNNQRMLTLRYAVFAADKDNGDVETALTQLRGYVYAHMNTNLTSGTNPVKPPIQLKYTYERLVASEKQRVSDAASQLYVEAGVACEGTTGAPRLTCVQDYVTAHPVPAQKIPDALYKFDFESPFWSPDLAGWSIVACIILGVLCAIRLVSGFFIRRQLKKQHH